MEDNDGGCGSLRNLSDGLEGTSGGIRSCDSAFLGDDTGILDDKSKNEEKGKKCLTKRETGGNISKLSARVAERTQKVKENLKKFLTK